MRLVRTLISVQNGANFYKGLFLFQHDLHNKFAIHIIRMKEKTIRNALHKRIVVYSVLINIKINIAVDKYFYEIGFCYQELTRIEKQTSVFLIINFPHPFC